MPGVAVQRVLDKLVGVKPILGGWLARCPSHEDLVQSLQISERPADLSVGLSCHAGCGTSDVLAAMNLNFSDLFMPSNVDGDGDGCATSTEVATYNYTDEAGTLVYQVVRYSPKAFKQRRPNSTGGWIWKLDGV